MDASNHFMRRIGVAVRLHQFWVYLFNETISDAFPRDRDNFSIEEDVFPNVQDLYTLQTNADWIDIGISERLAYARQHYQNGVFQ